MGAVEQTGKIVASTAESLGKSPLALGLIVVNMIFLFGGGWVIHDVAERTSAGNERRDKMLAEIIRSCRSFEEKRNGE